MILRDDAIEAVGDAPKSVGTVAVRNNFPQNVVKSPYRAREVPQNQNVVICQLIAGVVFVQVSGGDMTTANSSAVDQAQIVKLSDHWINAIRNKDVEAACPTTLRMSRCSIS